MLWTTGKALKMVTQLRFPQKLPHQQVPPPPAPREAPRTLPAASSPPTRAPTARTAHTPPTNPTLTNLVELSSSQPLRHQKLGLQGFETQGCEKGGRAGRV